MSCVYYAIDFETANDYSNSVCSVGDVRFVDDVERGDVYLWQNLRACNSDA